jgi:hypothetical protein
MITLAHFLNIRDARNASLAAISAATVVMRQNIASFKLQQIKHRLMRRQ